MSHEVTRKERMRRALERQSVDRLPVQTNYTTPMGVCLAKHFGCLPGELSARLDNHLLRVELGYARQIRDDGRTALDWWGAGWDTQTEGYWHTYAPLARPEDLEHYAWPDPQDPDLLNEAARQLREDRGQHFVAPNFGLCLFERAWSLRGFDQLLIDLLERPDWVARLLDQITEIQLALAERFIALGVDGGYFGDDYGAQRGMLFSPKVWRQLFKPRLARLFAVFRDQGLPVILHSDGDIWAILPDLIEIGLTCLNPVQPEVMDHARLVREFGLNLSFYGGISTQTVLPSGSRRHVQDAVFRCIHDLAPRGTGLILGPSHRMQTDIPVQNVEAMLEAFPK